MMCWDDLYRTVLMTLTVVSPTNTNDVDLSLMTLDCTVELGLHEVLSLFARAVCHYIFSHEHFLSIMF